VVCVHTLENLRIFDIKLTKNMEKQQTPIYQRAVTPVAVLTTAERGSSAGNGIVRGKALYYQQPCAPFTRSSNSSSNSNSNSSSRSSTGPNLRDSIRLVANAGYASNPDQGRLHGDVSSAIISEVSSAMSLHITGDNWVWQWDDTDNELERVTEVSLERVKIETIVLRFLPHASHLMNVKRLILASNGIETLNQVR
jgi:hypothetical protein